MADWSGLHARVHQRLRQSLGLPARSGVLVAVSGGQDSVCLLKLLRDLQPHWHWRLIVAHANHRWRDDADANAEFVAVLCDRWHLPCHIVTATAPPPTEAAARQWRYQQLEQLARADGLSHVVTGHTATDRAETLLYNLVRGSGPDGLQALGWQRPLVSSPEFVGLGTEPGAKPEAKPEAKSEAKSETEPIWLVRPLLDLTRADTAACCRTYGLPIWDDRTNRDVTYARNRLRLEVFPHLRQLNPQVERTLAHTAEVLSAEVEFLEAAAQELYQRAVDAVPHPPEATAAVPALCLARGAAEVCPFGPAAAGYAAANSAGFCAPGYL